MSEVARRFRLLRQYIQTRMHKGFTLWFTGLSGSGKTTIASQIHERLRQAGARVEMLDGDVVRENLSQGLGFSKQDRDTNIRRIGFVCERSRARA